MICLLEHEGMMIRSFDEPIMDVDVPSCNDADADIEFEAESREAPNLDEI